jgi:hypothetical protein
MPPVHSLDYRASSCKASTSICCKEEEVGRAALGRRSATARLPAGLVWNSNCTFCQCYCKPGDCVLCGILYHSPPRHWHPMRTSRHHHMAQGVLLRFYQSRPTTRLPVPRPCRASSSRAIQLLSIPSKHHSKEPLLLLVGTYTRLSTSLSTHIQDPLGLRL